MKTILIVDDDADDTNFLCEAIASINQAIRCICVSNGEHALKLLLNEDLNPPDFIFLDLNMPRLGGSQCLERIRKVNRLSQVPIIIYTTSKLQEDIVQTAKLGAVYFLTKPTRFMDLKRKVAYVLDNKWERVEALT